MVTDYIIKPEPIAQFTKSSSLHFILDDNLGAETGYYVIGSAFDGKDYLAPFLMHVKNAGLAISWESYSIMNMNIE